MVELTTNTPLVVITVTIITSVTTIIVTWLGARVNKKIKTRSPKSIEGYERLLSYMDEELDKARGKVDEVQLLLEKTRDQLQQERDISSRRREKLLEISRQYNVDVSSLV